jgi:hypothetical protein
MATGASAQCWGTRQQASTNMNDTDYIYGSISDNHGNRYPLTLGVPRPWRREQPVTMPTHGMHTAALIAAAVGIGIFALCPPALRGFLVLVFLGGLIWVGWTVTHPAPEPFRMPDEPAAAYTDYAPRAELVKLPNK